MIVLSNDCIAALLSGNDHSPELLGAGHVLRDRIPNEKRMDAAINTLVDNSFVISSLGGYGPEYRLTETGHIARDNARQAPPMTERTEEVLIYLMDIGAVGDGYIFAGDLALGGLTQRQITLALSNLRSFGLVRRWLSSAGTHYRVTDYGAEIAAQLR